MKKQKRLFSQKINTNKTAFRNAVTYQAWFGDIKCKILGRLNR